MKQEKNLKKLSSSALSIKLCEGDDIGYKLCVFFFVACSNKKINKSKLFCELKQSQISIAIVVGWCSMCVNVIFWTQIICQQTKWNDTVAHTHICIYIKYNIHFYPKIDVDWNEKKFLFLPKDSSNRTKCVFGSVCDSIFLNLTKM